MPAGLQLYAKRLALFPPASGIALVVGGAVRVPIWRFDEEMSRIYEEARKSGAPSLDPLPTSRQALRLQAAIGAAGGLGFAILRPALPRHPEAAALVYATLLALTVWAALAGIERAIRAEGQDAGLHVSADRALRSSAVPVLGSAAVIAAIERAITRSA